ncbi:MAG: hypothetical protein ABSB79_06230 [Syntrophales bacterium]
MQGEKNNYDHREDKGNTEKAYMLDCEKQKRPESVAFIDSV